MFAAKVITSFLNNNGFETETVNNGEEAIQIACDSNHPDLILMDIELAGKLNGIDASKIINKYKEIPIIFLTANTSTSVIDQIKDVTAYGFVKKGTDNASLLATIEMALKLYAVNDDLKNKDAILTTIIYSAMDGMIMIDIDENVFLWNPAAERLFGYSSNEIIGKNIRKVLHIAEFHYKDYKNGSEKNVLMSDVFKGKTIETRAQHKNGHIIDIESSISNLKIKNNNYFLGIIRDVSESKRANEELQNLTVTDYLTNTYNRRFFIQKLEEEIERSKRNENKFSIVMFDIDYFKRINDRFGHNCGDLVLKGIAGMVKNRIRKIDCFARWGGEEFMLLLPDTTIDKTKSLVEELRRGISKINISCVDKVTASFGVVEYCNKYTADMLIQNVDNMMYKAKTEGRNCICYLDDSFDI